jgi:hypothetical protein
MQLLIKDGKVISFYRDGQAVEVPPAAELVDWDGPAPEPPTDVVGGVTIVAGLPTDPRNASGRLNDIKKAKLKEIFNWDKVTRLAGVSIGPYSLRYDDLGQQRVMNLITSIRELVDQGVVTADTLITFEDASGIVRKVKASVLRTAVSQYFSACQAQEDKVGAFVAAVKAASTIEEVNSIIVG